MYLLSVTVLDFFINEDHTVHVYCITEKLVCNRVIRKNITNEPIWESEENVVKMYAVRGCRKKVKKLATLMITELSSEESCGQNFSMQREKNTWNMCLCERTFTMAWPPVKTPVYTFLMVLWLSHWNHIQDLVDASTAIQLCAVNLANCLYSPQPAYLYLVPDYLGTGTHLLFIYTLFIFVLYIYIYYTLYIYIYIIFIYIICIFLLV